MKFYPDPAVQDATLALQQAIRDLADGETLFLGGQTLHFSPAHARDAYYAISNNDAGMKRIAFFLKNKKNVTIDGEGASLLFEGQIVPFVADGCENITLKNFSIDYPVPSFFQAEITNVDDEGIELTTTPAFPARAAENGLILRVPGMGEQTFSKLLAAEFDRASGAPLPPTYFACMAPEANPNFLARMNRFVTAEQTGEHTIRLNGDFGCRQKVGNYFVSTFGGRDCPGIFLQESKNVLIEDVTLYHTLSMGLIGQLCENVTMRRLKTVVREGSGRYLSVNADSTHFVACSGKIEYDSCVFTSMMDDAGNVHSNYLPCVRALGRDRVLASFGHFQQKGVNVFKAGDVAGLIDPDTMQSVCRLTVTRADLVSSDFVLLDFDGELPPLTPGMTLQNLSREPEVYIHGCVTGHNRPRGFLISTARKAVVEDNEFFNMFGAVNFTGDCRDWFESGHVSDVLIRRNRFKNAAYAGGVVIHIAPHAKESAPPFHSGITVEDNVFTMHEERFLYATHCRDVVFRNNVFIRDESLPSRGKAGEDGFHLGAQCENMDLEKPVEKQEKAD